MAPSPQTAHLLKEAGLHSDDLNNARPRARRHFAVTDTIKEHKTLLPEEHAPNIFNTTPRSARTAESPGGMTSLELSGTYDAHHRKGRRHIYHGGCLGKRTPSEPSLASEDISEASADIHLGHREKAMKCWSQLHEQDVVEQDEPIGGVSSHHLARRKGNLGFGRRHYGPEHKWTHNHRSNKIDDPGGDDAFFHDGKFTSFLGPARRHHGKTFESDHAFDDKIEETEKTWMHSRKHFDNGPVIHANEQIPIGVSAQMDLHSGGFLGASKRNFGGAVHESANLISHGPSVIEEKDLDAYGLSHRGRRKFLVQNNLASGCRHNEAVHDVEKSSPARSVSTPDLQRYDVMLDAPYYQDDFTPEKQAKKELFIEHSNGKPRSAKRDVDQVWSALVWAGRGVDDQTAHKFIEGEDLAKKPVEAFQAEDFKKTLGHSKRSFGNCHNKSNFKMDYADDHTWKSDHLHEIPLGETDRHDDLELKTHPLNYIRWGHGHGRRQFKVSDHLDKDNDGVECYVSANGTVLGRMKHKKIIDHFDEDAPEVACFFMDPEGKSISYKPRHHVVPKDTVNELLDDDVKTDTSSTLGVVGQKRKNELLRPTSARRFPLTEKNFRPTPRSATPRSASQPKLSSEKRRWQV